VTEAITGLDLVEWQLRVAAGLSLPLTQDQIVARGHAIEVRLAAERPDLGFQPSVGTFLDVEAPPGLRFDTGVASGSEIGLHYDSMIAKLIAHGPDRPSAVRRLREGLDSLVLLGPATNQAFLKDCLSEEEFAEGRATTRFLARAFPDGWSPNPDALARVRAEAVAAALSSRAEAAVWHRRSGFRVMGRRRGAKVWADVADEYGKSSVVLTAADGHLSASHEGRSLDLGRLEDAGSVNAVCTPGTGDAETADVLATAGGLSIHATTSLSVEAVKRSEADAASDSNLVAPLPGVISSIAVQVGDRVARGDTALQMEAMKLVHTLAVAKDGIVTAVHCAVGDIVIHGTMLVEIAPHEET
jgi:acetyl/propionyl-CoA carboxylase alpha subunit